MRFYALFLSFILLFIPSCKNREYTQQAIQDPNLANPSTTHAFYRGFLYYLILLPIQKEADNKVPPGFTFYFCNNYGAEDILQTSPKKITPSQARCLRVFTNSKPDLYAISGEKFQNSYAEGKDFGKNIVLIYLSKDDPSQSTKETDKNVITDESSSLPIILTPSQKVWDASEMHQWEILKNAQLNSDATDILKSPRCLFLNMRLHDLQSKCESEYIQNFLEFIKLRYEKWFLDGGILRQYSNPAHNTDRDLMQLFLLNLRSTGSTFGKVDSLFAIIEKLSKIFGWNINPQLLNDKKLISSGARW